MPRKNRRDGGDPAEGAPGRSLGGVLPEWAQTDEEEVRIAHGQKIYRCPGCDHEISGGKQHLVVVPRDAAEDRRHWHTECWRKELRRLGLA